MTNSPFQRFSSISPPINIHQLIIAKVYRRECFDSSSHEFSVLKIKEPERKSIIKAKMRTTQALHDRVGVRDMHEVSIKIVEARRPRHQSMPAFPSVSIF